MVGVDSFVATYIVCNSLHRILTFGTLRRSVTNFWRVYETSTGTRCVGS